MANKVYVIVGPTSSGKTSLAIELCKNLGGSIISADSRQIYKYLDIGTGKIPIKSTYKINKSDYVWSFDNINIWGYDIVTPGDYYSAFDYNLFALNKAKELLANQENVFLVGGTGFYIDLFTKRILPSNVEPDFELRKKLSSYSLSQLQDYYNNLMSLNIKSVSNEIDLNNPARIIRAIEKLESKKINPTPLPYLDNCTFEFIGLRADNNYLYKKADLWVDEIFNNGLLDEVQNINKMKLIATKQLQGLVYKTAIDFLINKSIKTKNEVTQLIKYDVHHYIKRQLTYFNKNKEINWFDITSGDYKKNIYNLINE